MIERKVQNLLIIDDEKEILNLTSIYLKDEEHIELVCIDDPVNALDLLKTKLNFFDLIICDINMPNLTGIDLLRKIRRLGITTRWVFYTAYANHRSDLETDKELDISAYVEKPVRKTHFVQLIKDQLAFSNKS